MVSGPSQRAAALSPVLVNKLYCRCTPHGVFIGGGWSASSVGVVYRPSFRSDVLYVLSDGGGVQLMVDCHVSGPNL